MPIKKYRPRSAAPKPGEGGSEPTSPSEGRADLPVCQRPGPAGTHTQIKTAAAQAASYRRKPPQASRDIPHSAICNPHSADLPHTHPLEPSHFELRDDGTIWKTDEQPASADRNKTAKSHKADSPAVPSPGGEGQGEGGRSTELTAPNLIFSHDQPFLRLYHGDCFQLLDAIAAKYPQGRFDAIFADPPYFLSNGGITCHAGRMVKVDKGDWDKSRGPELNHEFNREWLARCQRVLKPNGTIWVSGTHHVIFSIGYAMQQLGYKILNDIAWEKPNPPPNLSCRYFTGIGMNRSELQSCFWNIGQSGKHTKEAKAAGVVGTFGIGGMANFGVCSELEITTRKATEAMSIICRAERSNLSASKECVFYSSGSPNAPRGTTIKATVFDPVSVDAATKYLEPIVQYIDFAVELNGRVLSQKPFPSVRREETEDISISEGSVTLSMSVTADRQGRAEASLKELKLNGDPIVGARGYFSLSGGAVASYQHGFMLARVPVSTIFAVGGILDCPLLRPTAGREALMSESHGLVQQCLAAVDRGFAEHIACKPELADQFSQLFHYIASRGRWELASLATIRVYGANERVTLSSIRAEAATKKIVFCYERHDRAIMEAFRAQGKMVVQLSNESRRQRVEEQFLTRYCQAQQLADRVTCLTVTDDAALVFQDFGFIYKLKQRLRSQYFIENISIKAGSLTHGAMLLAPQRSQGTGMVLIVDLTHPNIQRLIKAGNSLVADALFDMFVRDTIFPHLEGAFPELRGRDFDLLLQRLQSTVEYFQVDPSDVERLTLLAEVTNMRPEDVSAVVASGVIGRPSASSVNKSEVVSVAQVLDTPSHEESPETDGEGLREKFLARLLTKEINAKVLDATVAAPSPDLTGFYLALTPDAHILYRRVLERRPSADFMWGGYRAGFVFYEGGQGVLYYDIEFPELVIPEGGGVATERAGIMRIERQPLLAKNMVFVPIPKPFESYLVPQDSTLRFTIRHQILGVGSPKPVPQLA